MPPTSTSVSPPWVLRALASHQMEGATQTQPAPAPLQPRKARPALPPALDATTARSWAPTGMGAWHSWGPCSPVTPVSWSHLTFLAPTWPGTQPTAHAGGPAGLLPVVGSLHELFLPPGPASATSSSPQPRGGLSGGSPPTRRLCTSTCLRFSGPVPPARHGWCQARVISEGAPGPWGQ